MNQKEINELRRRFRPEKSAISRVYGCYVNSSKEIVSDLDESLGMMPQEESEKYLSLLKKGLSGSLGKNLIDIGAGGNLTGFASIVQAILTVYILWFVMEAAEAYPTAATLETGDAHHHALQTGLGGILGEIFCHGCLPLSEHKKTGAASLHIQCRCGPCSSNFTYPFVVPAFVPAPACPPSLGQCIRSLSLRSARL